MAHFRGYIQGMRGSASRLGSKDSGLTANIASWEGAVHVNLWHDEEDDIDMASVELAPHQGRGESRILYHGPVGGLTVKSHRRRA